MFSMSTQCQRNSPSWASLSRSTKHQPELIF